MFESELLYLMTRRSSITLKRVKPQGGAQLKTKHGRGAQLKGRRAVSLFMLTQPSQVTPDPEEGQDSTGL